MGKACQVSGCLLKYRSKGYCRIHYYRLWKYGDPIAPIKQYRVAYPCVLGRYKVLGPAGAHSGNNTVYTCVCSCGRTVLKRADKMHQWHRGCRNTSRFKHTAATTLRQSTLVADFAEQFKS